MHKLILNEFYNKVLPMIRDNSLEIDGWKFNIEFQTIMPDTEKYLKSDVEESLIINNVELFNKLLVEYTTRMLEIILNSKLKDLDYIYYNGNKKFMIDFIISNLWNNVTDTDLNNPIEYLQTRINFLDDPLYDSESKIVYLEDIDFLENSSVEYQVCLNNPILETPYSFKINIVRNKVEEEVFKLPSIYYGISNGVCFIYAVQRENKTKENNYTKKINRLLYKVNKDVDDDYELDNIKDVSPSAIVSLAIFTKILKENGIRDIRVVDYMPIRYKAKECAINKKIDKLRGKIKDEELNELLIKAQDEHIGIQKNITDKFLRNFRRLQYQLGNIKITSYPKDVDSTMHLILTDGFNNSDNILNKLYQEEPYKKKI